MSKEKKSPKGEKSLEEQNIETRERLMAVAEKTEETDVVEEVQREHITFDEVYSVRYTRELVVKGTDFRESVEVSELGEGAFLVMRPLTDSQFVEVQRTMLGDLSISALDQPTEKITGFIDREQKGKYLALSYALSLDGDEWTPEDIGHLPTGVPDKLYGRLALISGFPRPPASGPTEEKETTG